MLEEKEVSPGSRDLGRVAWFDPRKGYGFITPNDGGKDVFLHYSNIEIEGYKTVAAGQLVSYIIGANKHGPQAEQVKAEQEEFSHGSQEENK